MCLPVCACVCVVEDNIEPKKSSWLHGHGHGAFLFLAEMVEEMEREADEQLQFLNITEEEVTLEKVF